jgi:outer membrane protein assembly factor BamB
MTQPLSARARYQKLKDKKRNAQRRQFARYIAFGVLGLLVVALIFALIAGVRSCAAGRSATAPATADAQADAKAEPKADPQAAAKVAAPQLVYARSFKLAPWFVTVDNARLYAGESEVRGSGAERELALGSIAAYELKGSTPLWQQPLTDSFTQLGAAGGTFLALTEPSDEEDVAVYGFDGALGKEKWRVAAVHGAKTDLSTDGSTAVLSLNTVESDGLHDGLRLAGYNAGSGAKVWSLRPPLRALAIDEMDTCCSAPRLDVHCWAGLLTYRLHNVVGLVNAGSGKLIKEFPTDEHVMELQYDSSGKVCYIITRTETDGTYRLIRIPLGEAPAKRILEFDSPSDQFLLLAEQGNVLLAYTGEGKKGPATKLVAFAKDESKPKLVKQFEHGTASDMAALPSKPGEFLIALSDKYDDRGLPLGRTELHRVRLADGQVWEAARLKRPVLWMTNFKRDCVLLLRGGDIDVFNADSNRVKRLRHAKYDFLEPLQSTDKGTLLVSSYPAAYLDSGLSAPMQVLVFQ